MIADQDRAKIGTTEGTEEHGENREPNDRKETKPQAVLRDSVTQW